MAVAATLVGNGAYAQTSNANKGMNNKSMGSGAQQGTYSSYDNMAWGMAIGGLAVIGVVVGVTVAGAVSSTPSFSH